MPDVDRIDRDIRDLVQAVATLEVVVAALAGMRSPPDRTRLANLCRAHADRAVFEVAGLEPTMLDRLASVIDGG